ncbi:interleukin-1 beta [Crotalus adamanteus]|uniref:Interleukin-1 n=2 Tax=Crotalus TaxID=8728 RepID=A0AAW1AZX5_CROAD
MPTPLTLRQLQPPSSAPETETFDPENPRTGGQLVNQQLYKGCPGRAEASLQRRGGSGRRSLPVFSCSLSRMQFCAANQPYPTKNAFQASEIDVQVAVTKKETLKSFRKAVLIVIATESMRNSPRLFSDEDLMDILSTVLEPVTFDIYGYTEASNSIYHFWRNVVCNIQDADHKSLVFQEPAQLVAMHLQGPNLEQAVKLKMSVYRPKIEAGTQRVPVVLSIQNRKHYLSCVWKEGQPVLQLEEANIQGNLDKSELGRFLFYKIDSEKHTRFESAKFPGWFICTSIQPEEAVAFTKQPGGPRVIVDYSLSGQ